MYLYDNESTLNWSTAGTLTKEQMMDSPIFSGMFAEPAVIIDDGDGIAYEWCTLRDMAARWCVPYTGEASTLRGIEEAMHGAPTSSDIEELNSKIDTLTETSKEIQATADAATAKADEAIQAAQEAGTDAQVKTIAKLTAASIDFANVTATDCVAIPDYIPEWTVGMSLAQNDPVMRNGQLYRASQAIPSTQEQYPPETAGESLYYPVEVAPDGIIVYRECHGQYDMVRKGEKRHYPNADSPVYVALEDTAYSPDAYPQHWQLVESE